MTPVLQALVVADRVYEDKGTGKKIIAGTFSRLFFKKPAPAGQPIQIPPSGRRSGRRLPTLVSPTSTEWPS